MVYACASVCIHEYKISGSGGMLGRSLSVSRFLLMKNLWLTACAKVIVICYCRVPWLSLCSRNGQTRSLLMVEDRAAVFPRTTIATYKT